MTTRVFIRADASLEIGAGHVLRTVAIAEEFICRGIEVNYISQEIGLNWVRKYLEEIGITRIYGVGEEISLNPLTDILIVDSYNENYDEVVLVSTNWRKRVGIVDRFTRNLDYDLLFHPGFNGRWLEKNKNAFWGLDYILIRDCIATAKNAPRNVLGIKSRKILIFMGGSNSFGLYDALISEIDSFGIELEIYIPENLSSPINSMNSLHLFRPDPELVTRAQEFDLVISASGSACFELIAMEIPFGVVCITENQEENYDYLTKNGLAIEIGRKLPSGEWELYVDNIFNMISNNIDLDSIRNKIKGLIDCEGASRIVDKVIDACI